MSINKIRDAVIKAGIAGAERGPKYIEFMNGIREWMLDLAEERLADYAAVNCDGTVFVETGWIEEAIAASRIATRGDDPAKGINALWAVQGNMMEAIRDAYNFEDGNNCSRLWSASRASLVVIDTALSSINDIDLFSTAVRAQTIAEQCALVDSYKSLADEYGDDPVPNSDLVHSLAKARKTTGDACFASLVSALTEGYTANRGSALAP